MGGIGALGAVAGIVRPLLPRSHSEAQLAERKKAFKLLRASRDDCHRTQDWAEGVYSEGSPERQAFRETFAELAQIIHSVVEAGTISSTESNVLELEASNVGHALVSVRQLVVRSPSVVRSKLMGQATFTEKALHILRKFHTP